MPAQFNPLRYIYDLHYFKGDTTPRLVQDAKSRTANVKFVHNVISENFSDLNRGDIILVKTLRSIEVSEELLVTSGSSCIFAASPHVPGA